MLYHGLDSASLPPVTVDAPAVLRVVPCRGRDGGVEADVFVEFVPMRYGGKVVEDFLLTGVFPRPLGVLREPVRVEIGPDVAAASGVLVITIRKEPLDLRILAEHDRRRGATYFHVPPMPELFSTMMKLRHLLRVRRSMAMHMPTSADSVISIRCQAGCRIVERSDRRTRYARADNHDSCVRVVFVSHGDLRPGLRACHVVDTVGDNGSDVLPFPLTVMKD
jgi:hypothetical protein